MKKANSTIPILRMFALCFLLISFLSGSLNLPTLCSTFYPGFTIGQKVKGNAHTDSGLPSEEKEKEIESRIKEKSESPQFLHQHAGQILPGKRDRLHRGDLTHLLLPPIQNGRVPLYLTIRSLLI